MAKQPTVPSAVLTTPPRGRPVLGFWMSRATYSGSASPFVSKPHPASVSPDQLALDGSVPCTTSTTAVMFEGPYVTPKFVMSARGSGVGWTSPVGSCCVTLFAGASAAVPAAAAALGLAAAWERWVHRWAASLVAFAAWAA